jgi:hypothetical protein
MKYCCDGIMDCWGSDLAAIVSGKNGRPTGRSGTVFNITTVIAHHATRWDVHLQYGAAPIENKRNTRQNQLNSSESVGKSSFTRAHS